MTRAEDACSPPPGGKPEAATAREWPREFRGSQHYAMLASAVGLIALLFSSYSFGTSWNWGHWAFIGVILALLTLAGALVLFFRAYDTFAKKIVVDAEGLNFQHHSTVLLRLNWSQVQGLYYKAGPTIGHRRYLIRTGADTITLAGLAEQAELLDLIAGLSGRSWQPLNEGLRTED